MALPSSGQISLSQVNVEVGNASTAQMGFSFAQMRGLIGKASGVQFAMNELYGASSVTVLVANRTIIPTIAATIRYAGIMFNGDGTSDAINGGSFGSTIGLPDWVTSGDPADVEMSCTLLSGSLPNVGTMNTWMASGSWYLFRGIAGTTTSNLRFTFRHKNSLNNVEVADITLEATVSSGGGQ